jgi:glutathionylspermidine synthase
LERLKPHHDLVVVTSRQNVIQDETKHWIDTNFPGIFTDVHFGNHWAQSGSSKSKSDMCLEIGADVLIDDNPMYAYECAQRGIHVLLYNWQRQYPWSLQPPECAPIASGMMQCSTLFAALRRG